MFATNHLSLMQMKRMPILPSIHCSVTTFFIIKFFQHTKMNDKEHVKHTQESLVGSDGMYNLSGLNFDVDRLWSGSKSLTAIAHVVCGIKAYQAGKETPQQTEEDEEKKIFTATKKIDDTFIQCVVGDDFHRYVFLCEPEMYLPYGKWLAEPRESAPFFDDEKIILRRTADSLIATLDDQKRINLHNVYNIGKGDDAFHLKYILALLNSTLMNFIYGFIVQEGGRLFPEVKKANLAKLPIKEATDVKQQPFIALVDKMLSLQMDLSEKRKRFHRRLLENLKIVKITNALERFYELEFGELCAELTKQKRFLSLREHDAWGKYFERCKTECLSLSSQIVSVDHEIDRLVYALYGLTPEEIALIEGTASE